MKVLYIASNPREKTTLRLEQEITELQTAAMHSSGRKIEFVFLPAVAFEEIENQLRIHQPDVVHISAHGSPEKIFFTNAAEIEVELSAEALRTLLSVAPPRLVYINACNSIGVANEIVDTVSFSLGTSEAITNFSARKGAVAFYRSLLQGDNLFRAAAQAKSTTKVLSKGGVETELFQAAGKESNREYFHQPARLVAQFLKHDFSLGKEEKDVDIEIGLAGCAEDTTQIVVFTDDFTLISDNNALDVAEYLCSAVQDTPIRREIWLHEPWIGIIGDLRLYASGTTASGKIFSTAGTLCSALEEFYKTYFDVDDVSKLPSQLTDTLEHLRQNDGARLRIWKKKKQRQLPAQLKKIKVRKKK
jgi:hypothetical protein